LSQSDLRAHFGLGKATVVDEVEVSWPSGLRQCFQHVAADKFYVMEEGRQMLTLQKFARLSPAAK
ncbi:MAG TPA: ASPIC/UnbV domain-containing protein, partial [Terriglobales bacterium]|nr:ASPIC/UnbV domain-containing protein [Terriglobales bacterium]